MPSLSLISITKNDPSAIAATAASVANALSSENIEWCVWNGGEEIDPQLADLATRYERGVDAGIYDAMNRALSLATGKWVLFLNSGDELAQGWPHGVALLEREENADIVFFGYELVIGKRAIVRKSRDSNYLCYGMPTSHQATTYRRALLGDAPYRPNFRIAGDYELTARLWRRGATCVSSDLPLARFHAGGATYRNLFRLSVEAYRIERDSVDNSFGMRVVHLVKRLVRSSAVGALSWIKKEA